MQKIGISIILRDWLNLQVVEFGVRLIVIWTTSEASSPVSVYQGVLCDNVLVYYVHECYIPACAKRVRVENRSMQIYR